jgi:hypothetical protein
MQRILKDLGLSTGEKSLGEILRKKKFLPSAQSLQEVHSAPSYQCNLCGEDLTEGLVCPGCKVKDKEATYIERFKMAVYNII